MSILNNKLKSKLVKLNFKYILLKNNKFILKEEDLDYISKNKIELDLYNYYIIYINKCTSQVLSCEIKEFRLNTTDGIVSLQLSLPRQPNSNPTGCTTPKLLDEMWTYMLLPEMCIEWALIRKPIC